jgi:hypothetical protein
MLVAMSDSNVVISFYTPLIRSQFRKMLFSELGELEKRKLRYVIFRNPDMPSLKMTCGGTSVVGLESIKEELSGILAKE